MSRAIRKYIEFHQLEPKKIGSFHRDLVIPDVALCVGDAVHVLYKSDKLNPETGEDEGWINYIHEHKRGVKVYRCDRYSLDARGDERAVPAWLRNTTELVALGLCNGLAFRDEDGEHDVKATKPYPELYTTPSGKALLVIQGKRRLVALVWGGKLGVEPRGIIN